MSEKINVFSGARIGLWTVLEEISGDGERRWKCRCDCGTERDVLDRGLRYGKSLSCGCQSVKAAADKNAHRLEGRKFAHLTVLEQTAPKDSRKGRWWRCRCDCGQEIEIPGSLLVTGRKEHCGCLTQKNYAFADITGQRFRSLTALYPLQDRSSKGSVIWRCRCDCGNEADVPYNSLVYSNQVSCGCQKKEHDQILGDLVTRVAGTSIDHLRSKKVPKNSTTGVKGVYLIRGKYLAKIVFQKKQYNLGFYKTLQEAAEVRKEAEKAVNERVVDFYARWKQRADADPDWAKENPIEISVLKSGAELEIQFLPKME